MIAAGEVKQAGGPEMQRQGTGAINTPGSFQYPMFPGNTTNYNYTPKTEGERKKLFELMKGNQQKQWEMTEKGMKWNAWLQAGKLGAETLTKSLSSIFTHVANVKQMDVYNNYLNNQHDIATKSIALESKKLDVQKEMHNEQLRFQLKVAKHGKERDVTIAAITAKEKTKRLESLAALRTVYGRGKPVTPFQRYMT